MSQNCTEWLNDLRAPIKVILEDDLAALSTIDERLRIEDYNELKSNQQEFRRKFRRECPNTLRDDEPGILRARFRLARLLIVASFAMDGEEANFDQIPESLSGEFDKAAIDAIVAFERYKQFDNLSEDQINKRIRRMEGDVYELVKDYTNTQLADLDELLESTETQGDIMDVLSDRYEDRLSKIRQGFYKYVEYHGMDHMVSAVEDAVESVAEAQEHSERIDRDVAEELESLNKTVSLELQQQDRRRQQQFRQIEQEIRILRR
jgi:methyl-accepting chemotaxis protein